MNFDWNSKETYFFINPRIENLKNVNFKKIFKEFNLNSHVIIASSGSTIQNPSEIKFIALSKSAILNSSLSVNNHLLCSSKDVILNTLPLFHIGGLSTYSRAYLSGAKLVDIYSASNKWNPFIFTNEIENNNVTITSVVPTQIYDIVKENIKSPKTLRAVVVGGGALSFSLFLKAKNLGWPLLPSYGMTECCSQIATAPLDFTWESSLPNLKILEHLNLKLDYNGTICISGSSLMTGYLLINNYNYQYIDFKEISIDNNYFVTSDLGVINENYLNIYGRKDDVVKISAEKVSLNRLDNILTDVKSDLNISDEIAIIALPDERLENIISFVFLEQNNLNNILKDTLINKFNLRVLPFERVKKIYYVQSIPKSDLGKLKRLQLLNQIIAKK